MVCCFSCVRFFVTPWMVAHQAPLSMEFSRQEYWSGLPFPPPEDLPNPGIEPVPLMSPSLQAGSLPLVPPRNPTGPHFCIISFCPFTYILCGSTWLTGYSKCLNITHYYYIQGGFPSGSDGKESACKADLGSIHGSGRFPGEGNGTPVFLPGEFHGQRSLAGSSPWGHKDWHTTEWLTHIEFLPRGQLTFRFTVSYSGNSDYWVVLCLAL